MSTHRNNIGLPAIFIFALFLFAEYGFSQINFTYKLVGTAATSAYSDGTPYKTSTVNSKQLVQLKGKTPASGERIMLFSFLQVRDANGEFICKVDKSGVLAPYAMAGIMVRQSIEPGKDYSLIGFSGNNYIVYEQCINGTTSCMGTAKLPTGTNTFYLKAVVQSGLVSYYVAPEPYANISDWLLLGMPICIPNNVLVGPFLKPGSTSTYDIAKFTDFQNNLNGTIISGGLGKVAASSNNFDLILADLVSNHT
jgi:hypothetical protein